MRDRAVAGGRCKEAAITKRCSGFYKIFCFIDIDWQFKTMPQNHTGFALVNKLNDELEINAFLYLPDKVGGGSAGSVVASRLSEEPCVTVLLLEAGAKKPPLLNDVPGLGRFFWGTDIDWQFKTVPQKNTGFALVNKQVPWPSGKGLGGSSLLNAMLYVRGNRKDYDNWAALGAKGWSYKDVFPYFLKLEDNRDFGYSLNGYHASGGPITAEKPGYHPEIKNRILEAAEQLGYRVVDSNAARQTGFHDLQGNLRNGQRCNTAKAYLVPVENRTNLDIIGGAHVKKVVFEGSRAVGVQFDYKNSEYLVKARREVIMSAGTTNTAQLLMLSGIGPKKHLQKFNVKCQYIFNLSALKVK
ncbi:Glucose dehydrogenase [FAD, quinone] [Araneus ventricosus]|uniref:Glucose dehydrogenase [FAD, quinone] n=1 Tax=Araneus ventricosus TaxID=182803 RepID=A0A4Y2MEZ9_ARAVE|nr:Glucose dehydrogenase [FAD, quinone] [Araneus ventricosus]